MTEEEKEKIRSYDEIQDDRWKNRRKMAWIAFIIASWLSVMITVGIALLMALSDPDKVRAASEHWAAIGVILGGLWGVVMAYIGSAAYSEVRLIGR